MGKNLNLLYDKDADVLYVSLGHPEYTDYVELDDNFVLRLDPETKEIVGFTIIDFGARFAQKEPPSSVPLKATFERVGRMRKAKVVAERKTTYRVTRAKAGNGRKK